MSPIAAVPTSFLQYSRLQPRPKGYENRLTDAETASMVELQNANIRAEEKKLGRKLTNTEKLTIIGSTQRNFWAGLMLPTGTPGGYMGPGAQPIDVRPDRPGTGTSIIDSVVNTKPQTPPSVWDFFRRDVDYTVRSAANTGIRVAPLILAVAGVGLLIYLTTRNRT